MSTIDEFQKRISKLEVEVAEIRKAIEEIRAKAPVPVLPEASDFPEERVAEEAVEEASVETGEEE